MTKVIIDDIEVDVPPHYTLLQAAEEAGAEVPRFCFHERLSVAGNCRMCLVEVKGGPPKPTASCAMAVRDLRPGPNGEPPVVLTKSPMVKKAREGVMEFLLINHPLDCPICDQGGECDLQDQAMAYGVDKSRYEENKRAVEDKYIGPLVKTTMTRCIHCTRCVRFTTEVAGVQDLGATGRGEDMEITTYLEKAMSSEMQGNIVDLCPVGALTSKPYQNKSRPWELTKTDSIDVMDAVGSNIRIDSRGREVMRILPRLNEDVNEEWISDKTRHIVDGLKTQRLDKPYIRMAGKLQPASWVDAFAAIAAKVKGAKIGAIGGGLASVEELFALKSLMSNLGQNSFDMPNRGALHSKNGRGSYIFNSTIAGIEEADALLIIGSNPRKEAAVLNARIRKVWGKGGLPVAVIGEQADLTYSYDYLGAGPESLVALVAGELSFINVLKNAKKPMIIVGQGALNRADGAAILALVAQLSEAIGVVKEGWNGFNILHNEAALVGALDVGFVPDEGGLVAADITAGKTELVFNLGYDEAPIAAGSFVVYIGTHGDAGADRADVILPSAAYTEKSGTYVNTEGRVQMTNRATFAPGDAREDWSILRALSDALGAKLPFDTLQQLRAALYVTHPHFSAIDAIETDMAQNIAELALNKLKPSKKPFMSPIRDFYMTNPIARNSGVMAECSALAVGRVAVAAE
jgi:NADH-quinone oxidoreductase subunit G